MYRDSYTDPGMSQFNPPVTNYSYHPNQPMKISNTQTIPPNPMMPPQNPPLYYEPQTSMIDQGYSMMPVQSMYEPRYYWREGMDSKPPIESYQGQSQMMQPPNIVQRISSVVKAHLPSLQAIMNQVVTSNGGVRGEVKTRRSRSRERSRSRQKRPKGGHSSEWLCQKCSFSNYEWRDRCKKCNDSKASRGFIPGPQDWKCPKCSNINYARRNQCNRCKRPRNAD